MKIFTFLSVCLNIIGEYILFSGKEQKYIETYDAHDLLTNAVYQYVTSKTLLALVSETLSDVN
jgi:hypothetical protein